MRARVCVYVPRLPPPPCPCAVTVVRASLLGSYLPLLPWLPLPLLPLVHHRLLVVVCENKLLLYDLNTRKPFEVTRAAFDGRAPSCVAFLFRGGRHAPGGEPDSDRLMMSPVLAVGCADGAVRLLHLATLRVCAYGTHTHTHMKQARGT